MLVPKDFTLKVFQDLCDDATNTIEGCLLLSDRALILDTLAKEINAKLKLLKENVEKKRSNTKDLVKCLEFALYMQEQKIVVQKMRNIFSIVHANNKPEKFEARLQESPEFSHKLRIYFNMVDTLNEKIEKSLAKFFQDKVTNELNNQFDKLAD